MTTAPQILPARRGKAVRLRRGQSLKVINTHGQQVVDSLGVQCRRSVRVHVDGARARC